MIPKNQKTATSTNQQARITSKHELTSVQSSCIPTNQHHEPRTRIPASTYQGHGYQQSPTKDTNQPATSTKQARITSKHELTSVQSSCIPTNQQPAPSSNHLPRTRIPASTKQQSPTKDTNQPAASTNQQPAPSSNHLPRTRIPASTKQQPAPTSTNQQARITSKHELTSVQSSCIPTNQQPAPTSTNQQARITSRVRTYQR